MHKQTPNGSDIVCHSEAAVAITEQIPLSECTSLNGLCLHAAIMQICCTSNCFAAKKRRSSSDTGRRDGKNDSMHNAMQGNGRVVSGGGVEGQRLTQWGLCFFALLGCIHAEIPCVLCLSSLTDW